MTDATQVLTELLRLYDWRFELAAREKDPRNGTEVGFMKETLRLLRQYGAEKKAAWASTQRVLETSKASPAQPAPEIP